MNVSEKNRKGRENAERMKKSHSNVNASSTMEGFQFQVNVAIYFMLRYLKDIDSIRVEGEKEDVEVNLKDKHRYMIQAKAQTIDLKDNKNNAKNLKDALKSLANADEKNVQYLFYASNMRDPLNSSDAVFKEYNIVTKKYNDLSEQSQRKIDKQIANLNGIDINKDKLVIIRIPFFGEFEEEKYKFIVQTAKEVFSSMGDNIVYKSNYIVRKIESKFNNNGTDKKETVITKEDFCNWIILTEIEGMDLSGDNLNIGIDELEYYDAYEQYKRFIDEKMSSYENYGKVYSLFLRVRNNKKITINEFVKEKKLELYNYFFEDVLEDEEQINENNKFDIYVAQIISYAILKRNSIIKKIKEGAGLC